MRDVLLDLECEEDAELLNEPALLGSAATLQPIPCQLQVYSFECDSINRRSGTETLTSAIGCALDI